MILKLPTNLFSDSSSVLATATLFKSSRVPIALSILTAIDAKKSRSQYSIIQTKNKKYL